MSQPKYTRLSYEDRLVVGNRHAGGESVAEIAIAIGVTRLSSENCTSEYLGGKIEIGIQACRPNKPLRYVALVT